MSRFSSCLALLVAIAAVPVASSESTADESAAEGKVETVATFLGAQATGVTVSEDGRIFVCFPRWREGIPCSVAELDGQGGFCPWPGVSDNDWMPGQLPADEKFVCVQSVVADGNELFIVDTKNPGIRSTVATPTVYAYDLASGKLLRRYPLADSTSKTSYVNDVRIDRRHGKAYLTDSNDPGLIVLDLASGENYRMLDHHPFTTAEDDALDVMGTRHAGRVHADGLALDRENGVLYFHALTGHTLYGIPVRQLLERKVDQRAITAVKTPACDGMILDDRGNLYLGDLERGRIVYLPPDRRTIRTLAEGQGISWPDTFAIHDGWLYFTNSRIQEAREDIAEMPFTLQRVRLPE